MIIDVTGTPLTPGDFGKDCEGNGKHFDKNGELIECCCDECDYLLCCIDENYLNGCIDCTAKDCPRNATMTTEDRM